MYANKAKQGICYFLSANRHSVISKKVGLHHLLCFLGKTITEFSPLPHLFPSFIAEHSPIWCGICLWSVGPALPALSPPDSCPPPAYTLAGLCEDQERFWFCVRFAQQQLKHLCIIHTVSSTHHTKYYEKINSILAKTSTWCDDQLRLGAASLELL